jgi:hypothetical protein
VREVARVEHTQAPVDPAGRLSFSCEAQQDDAALQTRVGGLLQ